MCKIIASSNESCPNLRTMIVSVVYLNETKQKHIFFSDYKKQQIYGVNMKKSLKETINIIYNLATWK